VLHDDHREGKKVEEKKSEGKAGDARSKIRGGDGSWRDAFVEAPLTILQSCCDEMFSLVQLQGDFNSTFISGRC
jgi:hypothetical protein